MNRASKVLPFLLIAASVYAESPTANLVFLDGEIGEDARPRVINSRLVEGYLTHAGPYDGVDVGVFRLFPDAALGFQSAPATLVPIELPPPVGQYTVQVNQITADRSVSFFGSPGVFDPLRVEIDPLPGTYQGPLRVRFYAPDATTEIRYAIDGGAPTVWGGETVSVASDTTIQFFGTDGINPPVVKNAVYTFLSPPCLDLDSDAIPDRIEQSLKLDPLVAQGDLNGNLVDDFDEYIRGATSITPNTPDFVAPLMVDGDGDGWSDYDEGLRQTDPGNAGDKPVAPNMRTVELVRGGAISDTAPGATPPPAANPDKPFPAEWRLDSVSPDGTVVDSGTVGGNTWELRTGGHQFQVYRARANDGSGRVLLGLSSPVALCIDTTSFCGSADSPTDWRDNWVQAYEPVVFQSAAGVPLNPRTTAEALLLNRYYESLAGESFVIGQNGQGPGQDIVLERRARRNDAALYNHIAAAVTPAMIDLVADYLRYHTTPRRISFTEMLADHFGGRPLDPSLVPADVREANIALVAAQTAAFIASIPPEETILTGTISIDDFGFLLDVNGTPYRLQKLADTFVPGTTVSLRALVDIDNCQQSPLPAQVVGIVSRGLAPVAPIVDVDNDQLDDDWEFHYKATLAGNAQTNSDSDPFNDGAEYANGTNPVVPDGPVGKAGFWVLY